MTITKIFLLLVCAFVLVLLLSTIFNKYHRIIMWSAAIVFFIGTLLLIGLGIIDPIKDNRPDPVVITGIFTALVLSGLFAYGAEKLRIKLREKNQHFACRFNPVFLGPLVHDIFQKLLLSTHGDIAKVKWLMNNLFNIRIP